MFVIYLSSVRDVSLLGNAYGYYSGKCYTKDGEYFPITDNSVTDKTKHYSSEKRALNAAEAVLRKCGYVRSYKVENLFNGGV